MLDSILTKLRHMFAARMQRSIKIAAVQPLASGVVLYAADVDGRRIVMAASAHAICVLDRYPCPPTKTLEEPPTPNA